MQVKRNDPCPCGSGKKYKKCCMPKNNIVEFQQLKQKRFYDQKHNMVIAMRDFLDSKLTLQEENELMRTFRKRLDVDLTVDVTSPFFKFWLLFFHEFKNNLRGVHWFYKEKGKSLTPEEKEMAARWTNLVPKLVQSIDQNEEGMIVQDLFSHENFFMPYSETLQKARPWDVSLCLLESINNDYFINGVSSWIGPEAGEIVKNEINRLMSETGKPYHQVVMQYYPELLAIMINKDSVGLSDQDLTSKEVTHKKLIYDVHHKEKIVRHFLGNDNWVVCEWENNNGNMVWVGDWYCYKDSELEDPIYLAVSYGQLVIEGSVLTFESLESQKVTEFEKWMKQFSEDCVLKKREQTTMKSPVNANVLNYYVMLTDGTPKYFATFAQLHLHWFNLDHQAIPKFNGLSPMKMMELGKQEKVERWLQQQEYNNFRIIDEEFGEKAQHTADFNWIRKKLGLPLSPFVTNCKSRKTSIERSEAPNKLTRKIKENDLPYFKQLGFTPDTAREFYAQDVVDFFKLKTEGKSRATVYKYEIGLSTLVEYLSFWQPDVRSWEECNDEFWERLIVCEYLDFNYDATLNQAKGFFSAINMFVKWLDKYYKTNHSKLVKQIIKENEEDTFQTISFIDYYRHYYMRRFHSEMGQIGTTVKRIFENYKDEEEGLFQVIDITLKNIRVIDLEGDQRKKYTIPLPDNQLELIHDGMLFIGTIGKRNSNVWEIVDIDRVYPKKANRFPSILNG